MKLTRRRVIVGVIAVLAALVAIAIFDPWNPVRRVHKGMSRQEVEAILGEPDFIYGIIQTGEDEEQWYSWHASVTIWFQNDAVCNGPIVFELSLQQMWERIWDKSICYSPPSR